MEQKKIISLSLSGLVILALIFIPGYLRIRKLTSENRALERQISEIQQANTELAQEQQRLKNDPLYLEEVARKKLGIVKEGEIVYKVVQPQPEQ